MEPGGSWHGGLSGSPEKTVKMGSRDGLGFRFRVSGLGFGVQGLLSLYMPCIICDIQVDPTIF